MPTMLWRSKDAPHVTILGSIHFLDGPLPSWALEAAAAADRCVYEAEAPETFRFPEMPSGRTIFSLSPRLGRELAREVRRLRLSQRDIDHLHPFVATVVLSMHMLPSDISTQLGVEKALPCRAKPDYLETLADQVAAISTAPMSEQLWALDHFLKGRKEYIPRMRAAIAAWRGGALQNVWKCLGLSDLYMSAPNLFAGLFQKRHERWISLAVDQIKQAVMAGKSLLFVVGCAHLVGSDSFLDYLANEGYTFDQQT